VADPIAELLARLRARLGPGVDVTALGEVEREVRSRWGGQWIYVSARADVQARNSQIITAVLRGESLREVARRFGLSRRQVERIVSNAG